MAFVSAQECWRVCVCVRGGVVCVCGGGDQSLWPEEKEQRALGPASQNKTLRSQVLSGFSLLVEQGVLTALGWGCWGQHSTRSPRLKGSR